MKVPACLCTLFDVHCCQSVIRNMVYSFICRLGSSVNYILNDWLIVMGWHWERWHVPEGGQVLVDSDGLTLREMTHTWRWTSTGWQWWFDTGRDDTYLKVDKYWLTVMGWHWERWHVPEGGRVLVDSDGLTLREMTHTWRWTSTGWQWWFDTGRDDTYLKVDKYWLTVMGWHWERWHVPEGGRVLVDSDGLTLREMTLTWRWTSTGWQWWVDTERDDTYLKVDKYWLTVMGWHWERWHVPEGGQVLVDSDGLTLREVTRTWRWTSTGWQWWVDTERGDTYLKVDKYWLTVMGWHWERWHVPEGGQVLVDSDGLTLREVTRTWRWTSTGWQWWFHTERGDTYLKVDKYWLTVMGWHWERWHVPEGGQVLVDSDGLTLREMTRTWRRTSTRWQWWFARPFSSLLAAPSVSL